MWHDLFIFLLMGIWNVSTLEHRHHPSPTPQQVSEVPGCDFFQGLKLEIEFLIIEFALDAARCLLDDAGGV